MTFLKAERGYYKYFYYSLTVRCAVRVASSQCAGYFGLKQLALKLVASKCCVFFGPKFYIALAATQMWTKKRKKFNIQNCATCMQNTSTELASGRRAFTNKQISLWFINNTSSSCHRIQTSNAHVCQTANNKDQAKCNTQRILRKTQNDESECNKHAKSTRIYSALK